MPAVGRLWPSDDDDEDRDDADATDVDDGGLLLVGCPPSKRIKLILFHPYCTQPSFSRKHFWVLQHNFSWDAFLFLLQTGER